MAARQCKATNKAGKPCGAFALKGGEHCLSHDAVASASVGFVADAGKFGGRPRRPREIELIQEVADEFKAEMRAVLVDGLKAERAVVVGNGPAAFVEYVPDQPQRLATFREIYDRLHGRPTTTVAATVDTQAVNLSVNVDDPESRQLLAELLRRRPVSRGD